MFRLFKRRENDPRLKVFDSLQKQRIDDLVQHEYSYLQKALEIDEQIIAIQRSTATAIPQFTFLHNFLRMRYKWYYRWHLKKIANPLHWLILLAYIIGVVFTVRVFLNGRPTQATTSGTNSPGTMATDSSSGGTSDWTTPDNAKAEDGSATSAWVGTYSVRVCLSPDTIIWTESGNKYIKDLQASDRVYSYNLSTHQIELKGISNIVNRSISYYGNKYYHIYAGGNDVRATYNHRFWVNGSWTEAKDLAVGDEIIGTAGGKQSITKIEIEDNYTDNVWDISVNDNQNFFAGGMLVHNEGVYDYAVRIIKGGTIGSTDRASGTAWSSSSAYTTYGSSSDLWGETWSASDINSANFGFAISAYGSGYTSANKTTYYLKATNFGFTVPDGATINGITAEVKKYYALQSTTSYSYIDHIRITVNYSSTITVSGNVYTAEDKSANIGASKTIALSVNGGTKTTVETTSGGAFSFSGVTVAANDTVTIFEDDEGSEEATLITQAVDDSTNITGLALYTNKVVLTSQTSNAMTNTLLATADNCADDDIKYTMSGSDVTVSSGFELWIEGGKTYTPGGNVSASYLEVRSTATFSPEANTVTISGVGTPFVNSGTFNASSSTIKYTGGGLANTAATTYNNLTLDGPSDSYTKSLLHMNGANNSTTFTDELGKSYTAVGDSKLSTTQKKFGETSGYFDGTGDYLKTTENLSDFAFGSGDFTIDTWAYTTDSSANQRMIAGIGGGGANWSDSGGHQWIFYIYQNYLYFQSHVSGNSWNTVTSTSTVSIANAWHHLAVVCYNDTLTIYLDGTSVGSGTVSTVDVTTGGTQEFEIGSDATHQSPWQGYLDDFRVSKGVARWTSGFSVPTAEYTTAGYYTAAGDTTVSGILNINSGTFSGSNKNITLSGSGTPFTVTGTFTEGTSTITYTGGSATNITGTTYYNLTLNHTGTTFTSAADSTVKGVFTITAGTFDASNDTLTLSGTGTPFVNSGTFTASTSTVKYSGAGNTTITAATYNNLETKPSGMGSGSGWVASDAGDNGYNGAYTQSGTYGSSNKPAYTNGTNWLFSDYDDYSSMTDVWCLAGSKFDIMDSGYDCNYLTTSTDLPGTNWSVGYSGTSPAPTLAPSSSPYTYTLATGTINVSGNYTNGDGTNSVITTADTNDPTFNIDGSFTNSASATFTASASGSFSVGGDFTLNSTSKLTDSSGTLTLDGTGAQTITTNGTDGDHDFNNLTITNGSASGVTFADSVTVTGTFTDTTASSKLTFDALSTYAFANININGQASGTKIVMASNDPSNADLPSRQWYFNVSQTSPTASYVNVTDSDANGGNTITSVSCTNGGNNENWQFNTAPENDSLTFTNPYSGTSNVAVADNTVEWNFRALVTDADGPTNINYVELRLANSADNSAPYDSLKFRWTESTDTFSEEADTQNAASVTSTSSNSSVSGNQWTLDFKIKLNDSFTTKDTLYGAQLYAIDDSSADASTTYTDLYQVTALALTASVDSNTLPFGQLLPGSVLTGTSQITVSTNAPNGYSIFASDSIAGNYSALLHQVDSTTRIADFSGLISAPTSWSGTGLGICVYYGTQKDLKWGNGTTESDSANYYAGVPETAAEIHKKTGSPTVNDLTKVGYKIVAPNTQKTGNYSGIVQYTVISVLN